MNQYLKQYSHLPQFRYHPDPLGTGAFMEGDVQICPCCGDYCAYLGTVGTQELKSMDIADEVLREYEARGEFVDVEQYLTKDGSLCGYLFRCLHCGKHHLFVDAN